MLCPACNTEIPYNAQGCVCGYQFAANQATYEKPSSALLIFGWIFSILGGWLGIVLACMIAFSKSKYNKMLYRYDEASRKNGKIMLCVAIAMTVIGIFLRFI